MVFKEDIQKINNTLIGMSPKRLPSTLNKGDIVKHGNYLYKYKGENNQRVELIDEALFKKVGIRYKDENYKVVIFNEMMDVYQYLFEKGMNGHNITNQWRLENGNANLRKYNVGHGVNKLPSSYLNSSNTRNAESVRETLKNAFKCTDEEVSVIDNNNYRQSTFPPIKSAALNAEVMGEYNDIIERFNRGESTYPKYKYFEFISNGSNLYSYETRMDIFVHKHGVMCYQIKEDSFSYGIYGGIEPYHRTPIKHTKEIFIVKHANDDDSSTGHLRLNMFTDRGYVAGKTRFWLPYFNDIIGYDTGGKSARYLNENFNHYGLYFDLYDEGIYEFSFNLYLTNRQQHEENGTKGPWGARYAFYPKEDNVRGDGDSYCNFKKDRPIPCKLKFRYENRTFSEVEVITENKSNDVLLFINEMMNGKGYQTFDNRIYVKIFYAIWSYDDAGDWNEWQFAHVTAPYILEFKGE